VKGICGIVFKDRNRPLSPADLKPMVHALDDSACGKGLAIFDGSVGLTANQGTGRFEGVAEMTSEGKRLLLAFHGTVYNLRDFPALNAPALKPWSMLLQLYITEGIEFLHRLRGDFCLAIWDGRSEVLRLATDRFRVRPIFYYEDREKLLFATQMKGLLASPLTVTRTVNVESIVDMVASSIVPTPKTIFREVKKLPPGYSLTYQSGVVRLAPYWEISFLNPSDMSIAALTRELKVQVADAISVRLDADGNLDRIGTFLSGGVDSSTVTGVLTQLAKRPVKSFSIGFDEAKFNEIDYARIAARAFGSEHYEYFVTPRDVYDAIPILMESFDEPFANASAVPTYFCAKLAKAHGIDVLYAGDGGDELFAGNQRYAEQRLFDYYYKIPGWLRRLLVKPSVFAVAAALELPLFIKAKNYIQRASIPYPQRLTSYGLFKVFPMTELFTTEFLEAVGTEVQARTELDRQLYVDLKMAISDNDLFKVTKMTEAAGITVRFPYLDHVLAEFAASISAGIKMRGRELRTFFKNAYSDLLPAQVRAKTKHGFGLPIPIWLRTDRVLNDLMHEVVLSSRSVQRGYFRRKSLEKVVELHKHDETSFYGTILWNLMILELWHRTHLRPAHTASERMGRIESATPYFLMHRE
jgi:asparagine synthase (glutamine-hydrolysing)